MTGLGMPDYVLRRVTLPPAQGGQQWDRSDAVQHKERQQTLDAMRRG